MNKQSENKATPVNGDQNKTKITKDELSEQELEKASGGWGVGRGIGGTPALTDIIISSVK